MAYESKKKKDLKYFITKIYMIRTFFYILSLYLSRLTLDNSISHECVLHTCSILYN